MIEADYKSWKAGPGDAEKVPEAYSSFDYINRPQEWGVDDILDITAHEPVFEVDVESTGTESPKYFSIDLDEDFVHSWIEAPHEYGGILITAEADKYDFLLSAKEAGSDYAPYLFLKVCRED